MFKLIESSIKGFIRFPQYGDDLIKPGMIVQLIEINKNIYCELSDGTRPFGVVSGVDDSFIKIFNQKMIFRTDRFEINLEYKSGSLLFVNEFGLLTTKKFYEDSVLVGKVISDLRAESGYIDASWI
jgi:hypothetical protein